MDKLPEEILREILSYNILIRREAFLLLELPGEYTSRARNPQLLRVSKRWLRIGTPLLYTFLWLATPEQVAAVAALFRAHPHVGRAVRGLQLEGGFGRELVPLVRAAPNVEDVYLHLGIKSADSVAGLTKALALFDPSGLYVGLQTWRDNASKRAVWAALHTCVTEKWTKLRVIDFWFVTRPAMTMQLVDMLARSSIKELACSYRDIEGWISKGHMKRILEAPHLERVACRGARKEPMIRGMLQDHSYSEIDMKKFCFVREPLDDDGTDDEWDLTSDSDTGNGNEAVFYIEEA
ncbi:hypothetical protein PsYK624_080790 [Phanerochaete sordida]|uniref:Uncharacterized protein n=1 Tax=Phanerochaete sordida TaxID=48140 RepID=A0A9P3G9X0_9APHY|nr:hypothetical protein PsYK624_080790 [Phanerochaete sordida]